ncbi:MAG: baseplate J/gp47 family protein [Candidatus Aquicultor sp.]
MKDKAQILQDMISDIIAETDQITYFGKDGVARGVLNAVSNTLVEVWTDVFQTKRGLHTTTAAGADLDLLAARWGLTRLGARKSSVVLLFNGPATTVIPINTIIVSSINTSIQYQTLAAITLGTANPDIQRPVNAESIGDIVLVESLTTGSSTKVSSGELTRLLTPITGVTVTNIGPSQGGADIESDEELRTRILAQIDLYTQGTQAFYEALAKDADTTVLHSLAVKSASSVDIYLIKNSLMDYTQTELDIITTTIYDKQRAFQIVACKNAVKKSIEINGVFFLKLGYTQTTVFSNVVSKIADYISSIFEFGSEVNYNTLIAEILKADGVAGLDLSKFSLNGAQLNVQCLFNEVPVFTYLKFADPNAVIIQKPINQTYLVV